MRKAILALTAAAAVTAAALFGVLRVVPGAAAWNARSGELAVAGPATVWLPSWRWRDATSPTVTAAAASSSSDGASVAVRVTARFPSGRRTIGPAETPEAALAAVVGAAARRVIGAVPLRCFAGATSAGCPASPARALAAATAAALGLPEEAVNAEAAPDAAALRAARAAFLRDVVGKPARRVMLIGWDGADWEVLEPLARRGAMPNLARLMAAGTWGELASITPLLSPLVWTTIATGVTPDEHGILDFVEVDPDSGETVPVTGRRRRVPALWNMASAAGLAVDVSGWWASWPAEPVDGVLISDRLFFLLSDAVGEGPAGTVVYPPDREPAFRELAGDAASETDESVVRALLPASSEAYRKAAAAHRGMSDPVDGFRRILVGTRTYFGCALLAAETASRPADLTMAYAIGTDEIGHLLSPYLPPPLSGADPEFSRVTATGVERYFSVVDRWLGRLVAACPGSDCAVLVVSDHGFKWGTDRPREFSGTAAATAALWHRPNGVFVLAGNGVERRGRVAAAPSVYDVAPTVAALLGLPPGECWRGRPLPGCRPEPRPAVDWETLVPPETYHPRVDPAAPSPEYVRQLRSLGYMESGEGGAERGDATEGQLNNLGLAHLDAKRYAEAEKAFAGAVARNPGYASPNYNLRRAYLETGRYEDADAELWRAVDLKLRDSVGAVDRAAVDYESHGLPERAAGLLAEARRRFPAEARLAVHRIALLVKLERCGEALAVGRGASARFPADPRVYAFCGMAAACAGDRATAATEVTRSLELDPIQPEIRRALEEVSGGG